MRIEDIVIAAIMLFTFISITLAVITQTDKHTNEIIEAYRSQGVEVNVEQ